MGQVTADNIMSASEMKPLLMKSKEEPVNCAIGLTDTKDGVVLLHRKTKPRKLMADLRSEAKKIKLGLDASSLRFGTAEVDPEIDSALVRFRVNKTCAGTMEAKLRAHLKGSGFQKVEIVVDERLELEPESEAESEGEAKDARGAGEPDPAPQPAASETPAPQDAGKLTAELASLIPQIKGVSDASLVKRLSALAGAAANMLKTGNLEDAGRAIDGLRAALADAASAPASVPASAPPPPPQPPQQEPPPADGGPVTRYQKSRQAWLATCRKIAAEIDKLGEEIDDTYYQTGVGALLHAAYKERVKSVLKTLDTSLSDTLAEAEGEAEERKRAALVVKARRIIEGHRAYVERDGLLGDLDDNPFVKLNIRATLGATLEALDRAVR